MSTNARRTLACLATVPVGIAMIYLGLVAALSLIQQVLSGFFDLSEASWTSFLNPRVILGIESPGGTGGIFDALVGGPGAAGGSVNRYIVFMVAGVLAYGLFMLLTRIWRWAK